LRKILSKENIGFGSLQWLFWSAHCTLFAFLVMYLKTRSYNEVQIGIVMSVISITSVIGQPFWGHHSDRRNALRNVLVFCMLTAGITALLIPLFIRSFVMILVIAVVISFTENSMPSIIDSWTMNHVPKRPWIDYGLTRGLGSLGFAVTAVLFGVVMDRYGYGLMFPIHITLVFLTVGACYLVDRALRSDSGTGEAVHHEAPTERFRFRGSRRFVWFLISSTLVFIGFRATATFYPHLLAQVGGDNKALGLSLSVMALSEVPVLFLSKKLLTRYRDTALIVVSMLFFLLRIYLHIVVHSVAGLIVVQATQSLSFALFLPASVYYIKRISPPSLGSTYLTIASSCYFGIGGIIGSYVGGLLIDVAGISTMLWWGIGSTVVGMLLFLFSPRSD
jgi:MFS transporter, PPP family, 3-phenylpropionic acid transporter